MPLGIRCEDGSNTQSETGGWRGHDRSAIEFDIFERGGTGERAHCIPFCRLERLGCVGLRHWKCVFKCTVPREGLV